nr:HrpT family type III secretion system protein [uncultured Pseudomonas sp.]
MSPLLRWMFVVSCAVLSGCTTHPAGCNAQACERPDSNDRELVIWWPEDMRTGLENPQRSIDFTVVPLRD